MLEDEFDALEKQIAREEWRLIKQAIAVMFGLIVLALTIVILLK